MWIQVRTMDGKVSHKINNLSKLTKIENLRDILVDLFDIPASQQRLFYRGKQMEDGHTLFDYDVRLNDIVQILAKQTDFVSQTSNDHDVKERSTNDKNSPKNDKNKDDSQVSDRAVLGSIENSSVSEFFKVGDLVDAKDKAYGAWFEAKIIGIQPKGKSNVSQASDQNSEMSATDGLVYSVMFEDDKEVEELNLGSIRPRARRLISFDDIQVGDKVMVNYNFDEPTERGLWYDCIVSSKKSGRNRNYLFGKITMGPTAVELQGCKIQFVDEIYAIEETGTHNLSSSISEPFTRSKLPKCSRCKDNPSRRCRECSCRVCGGKDEPEKQILCDECDNAFHIRCLDPPLSAIPEDDWYCTACKNDENEVVRAGEKLKASKKKSKLPSTCSSSSRDWGKGMACVGRTRECTLVPKNHFGPVPGVEVGMMWKYRIQVAESGVHRAQVAGIHGRENEGAFSIVLSGGYEDDLDKGEEFYYTGSGGRDLSGNKRCAAQSCDQTLTRMNKALAINCNIPLNSKGGEAKDWRGGKAVRVVRNFKGHKHSEYCPEEGNRYDGIYKVVKYWPEKGKSGFLVWRYFLRRDDPVPAPWTKEGKKRIQELGLEMQYPEGYDESKDSAEESTPGKRRKSKRECSDEESGTPKRKKVYQLPRDVMDLIKSDAANQKLWDDCLESVENGKQEFLKKVEEVFICICCQDLVLKPITTSCSHNICKECLKRSFSAEVYSCPMCRQSLERDSIRNLNSPLQSVLDALFPGYGAAR